MLHSHSKSLSQIKPTQNISHCLISSFPLLCFNHNVNMGLPKAFTLLALISLGHGSALKHRDVPCSPENMQVGAVSPLEIIMKKRGHLMYFSHAMIVKKVNFRLTRPLFITNP